MKRINIVRWESEAFRQISEAYGVKGIPYLRVYGPDGTFLGEADSRSIEKIVAQHAKRR